MSSEKQILANRRNAQKSTGPQTIKGKTASRNNAFKHGLLSTDVIIPGEDPEKFSYLKSQLDAELEPVGFQEAEIVERMAILMWRLRRLYRVEAGIFAYEQAVAEVDRAREERGRYEDFVELLGTPSFLETQISDEVEHAKASEIEDDAEKQLAAVSASIGIAFIWDAKGANALTKLSRYETMMERTLSRLRMELERLQRVRKEKLENRPVTIDHVDGSDC